MEKDVAFMGKGSSDPYVILTVSLTKFLSVNFILFFPFHISSYISVLRTRWPFKQYSYTILNFAIYSTHVKKSLHDYLFTFLFLVFPLCLTLKVKKEK